MGALRDLSRTAVLCVAILFLAAASQATPLGLQVGDEITSIEWDSLQSVAGDGASWNVSTGIFHSDGRINSVQFLDSNSPSFPTTTPSGVTMRFDLGLASQWVNILNPPTNTLAFVNATMPGAFTSTPSFEMFESNVMILSGQFSAPFYLEGNIDLTVDEQPLIGIGKISVDGGDPSLIAALGGMGAQANLLLTGSIFGWNPSLNHLASTGNLFDSNFTVSLQGTLIPISPSPFVPEPTTALLLGVGLVGLLALGRRRNR
jgi:hypothetical protein